MAASSSQKGELPPIRHCKVCGKALKPTSVGRAYEQSLCFQHWAQTDEGKQYLKDKRTKRRNAEKRSHPSGISAPCQERGLARGSV